MTLKQVRSTAWDTPTSLYRFLVASDHRRHWHTASLMLHGQAPMVVQGQGKRTAAAVNQTWDLPLRWGQRMRGTLRLVGATGLASERQADCPPLYGALAHQCASIGARLHSQQWVVQQRLGAPCLLGFSQAMTELDAQLTHSLTRSTPVVLYGAGYNEALQAAAAIHYLSAVQKKAFVCIDWGQMLEPPQLAVARAHGGTLFVYLRDNDAAWLQSSPWRQLLQLLQQGETPSLLASATCRLIVAFAHHAPSLMTHCAAHGLRDDSLYIALPALVEREQDLPVLIHAVLDYHGHDAKQRCGDDLHHWCRTYSWPGHADELERVLGRMAVLSDEFPIGTQTLCRLAPDLIDQSKHTRASLHVWVSWLVQERMDQLRNLHPALQRALRYLSQHWREALTMDTLATAACVSASHLRYLLQKELQLSFKQLLQTLRVAHAEKILLNSPHQRITEVALSVGFNDFSHFQKCFRRIMGCTPTQLRQSRLVR